MSEGSEGRGSEGRGSEALERRKEARKKRDVELVCTLIGMFLDQCIYPSNRSFVLEDSDVADLTAAGYIPPRWPGMPCCSIHRQDNNH